MTDPSAVLPAPQRRLHRTLLAALMSAGSVPGPTELAAAAGLTPAELARHLDTLAAADYPGRTPAGAITCLYPFSVVPTPHTVDLGDARRYAMCSIDALGVAAMVGRPVAIAGVCGACAVPIRIAVTPGLITAADPPEAVVVVRSSGAEPAHEVCCPGTLFACGPAHGMALSGRSPENLVVPLDEALRHAESIFAGFLAETLPARRPRSEATTARLRT